MDEPTTSDSEEGITPLTIPSECIECGAEYALVLGTGDDQMTCPDCRASAVES